MINKADDRIKIGKRASVVGICCNIVLFFAKVMIGILSGAVSVIADAVNNLSDVSGALVSLFAFRLSEKPADSEHPYGHARIEYISGMVVATLILFIGFELVKTSVGKIISPTVVKSSSVTVIVLVLSILTKLFLMLFNKSVGKKINSTTLIATSVDSRNDVIATTAVLISILVSSVTDVYIDGYISLCVALFVIYSSILLMRETVNPLMGTAADPYLRGEIIKIVEENQKVLGCHDLLVHDYGYGNRFASIHIEMDKDEDILSCHEIIDEIEDKCLLMHGVHLVTHLDPVITDDEEIDKVKSLVQEILFSYNEDLKMHDFRMVKDKNLSKLIFDVSLPDALLGKEKKLLKYIEEELLKETAEKYELFVTFDPEEYK